MPPNQVAFIVQGEIVLIQNLAYRCNIEDPRAGGATATNSQSRSAFKGSQPASISSCFTSSAHALQVSVMIAASRSAADKLALPPNAGFGKPARTKPKRMKNHAKHVAT
jgi:hypothetical protein